MTRETGAQRDILEQQLDHDRRMKVIDRLNDLIAQGSKSLAILNGGAVIAMLAFVQALGQNQHINASSPMRLVPYLASLLVRFLLPLPSSAITAISITHTKIGGPNKMEKYGLGNIDRFLYIFTHWWRTCRYRHLVSSVVCDVQLLGQLDACRPSPRFAPPVTGYLKRSIQ